MVMINDESGRSKRRRTIIRRKNKRYTWCAEISYRDMADRILRSFEEGIFLHKLKNLSY